MSSLAGVLDDLDQSEDAERMYLECLLLKREIFPSDHPEILTDLNNLAEVLRQRGELSQAKSMHREALRLQGNRDAGLWSVSRANLGRVLYLQGRYDEAVDMFQQALASTGEAATEPSPFVEMVSDRLEAALRDQKGMRKKNGVYERLQWVATGTLMGRVWGKGYYLNCGMRSGLSIILLP
jgi:tetratricopeptide (TPR) repeat protein